MPIAYVAIIFFASMFLYTFSNNFTRGLRKVLLFGVLHCKGKQKYYLFPNIFSLQALQRTRHFEALGYIILSMDRNHSYSHSQVHLAHTLLVLSCQSFLLLFFYIFQINNFAIFVSIIDIFKFFTATAFFISHLNSSKL